MYLFVDAWLQFFILNHQESQESKGHKDLQDHLVLLDLLAHEENLDLVVRLVFLDHHHKGENKERLVQQDRLDLLDHQELAESGALLENVDSPERLDSLVHQANVERVAHKDLVVLPVHLDQQDLQASVVKLVHVANKDQEERAEPQDQLVSVNGI